MLISRFSLSNLIGEATLHSGPLFAMGHHNVHANVYLKMYANVLCLWRQDSARLFSLLLDDMLQSLYVPFNHSFGHVTKCRHFHMCNPCFPSRLVYLERGVRVLHQVEHLLVGPEVTKRH